MIKNLLKKLTIYGTQKSKYFDAIIYGAYFNSNYEEDSNIQVLHILCERILCDNELCIENGSVTRNWINDFIIRDSGDKWAIQDIKQDEHCRLSLLIDDRSEDSLYSQLMAAAFQNNDISVTKFEPRMLEKKFIRLSLKSVWKNKKVLEIQPLPNVTEKIFEYYNG